MMKPAGFEFAYRVSGNSNVPLALGSRRDRQADLPPLIRALWWHLPSSALFSQRCMPNLGGLLPAGADDQAHG